MKNEGYVLGERDGEGRAGEEDAGREEGLLGDVLLDEDEQDENDESTADGAPDDRCVPRLLVAWMEIKSAGQRPTFRSRTAERTSEGETDEKESDRRDEGDAAEEVDALDLGHDVAGAGAGALNEVSAGLVRVKGTNARDVNLPGDNGEVEEAEGDLNQEGPVRRKSRQQSAARVAKQANTPAPSDRVTEESTERSTDGRTESAVNGYIVSQIHG